MTSLAKTTLSSDIVWSIFEECLFQDAEVRGGVPHDAVLVEGIVLNVGFHPKRLENHRVRILDLLDRLPAGMLTGASFLELVVDRSGHQWASHRDLELLMLLGLAIGRLEYVLPRRFWSMLPGGMPVLRLVVGEANDEGKTCTRSERVKLS